MMKAILIAFSTYSKIPMPHFKWDPKALQYSMCAFPLVGAVIGAGEFAIWYLFGFLLQWSEVFTAALLTIFPILITGGIHMDGFLDTVDAKSSYKSKEETPYASGNTDTSLKTHSTKSRKCPPAHQGANTCWPT